MIPIQNLYYLLCYAWNTLEERDVVPVSQGEVHSLADLFARILAASTAHLIKRGLDRQYVAAALDSRCLRGKLDLTTTAKRGLLRRGEVHVIVDSFSHNVLHNQILKTTLGRVLRCENIDGKIHAELLRAYRYLHEIPEIPLKSADFARVRLHRNNSHYRLPLAVCQLIHDNRLIDERGGRSLFRDFLREDKAMARLFEQFLRQFYAREQQQFRVHSEHIAWRDVSGSDHDLQFLPRMRTDVSLESGARKIVIDAKYSHTTLQTFHEKETIKSGNLYQLYAYLGNLPRDGRRLDGLLLYPTTSRDVRLRYQLQGHGLQIATVNLAQPWPGIHDRLLEIINY